MAVTTFPGVHTIAEQANAGYSMFDTGTATWNYLNSLTPGTAFAASVKGVDFAFNFGAWIYSQTGQFAANPVLAQLQMSALAEKLAKIGLPLDMASSVADLAVLALIRRGPRNFDPEQELLGSSGPDRAFHLFGSAGCRFIHRRKF